MIPQHDPNPGHENALWNGFVEAHPEGTICHRHEWKRVLEEAYGWTCHYLSVDRDGITLAILPLVEMRRPLGRASLVSLPYLDQGGLLATTPDDEAELLDTALATLRLCRGTRLHLRGPLVGTAAPEIAATGRVRMVLRLADDTDALWAQTPSKVRNQIRKSRSSGLTTTLEPAQSLPDFYSVYSRNMRDLGSPPHTRKFFEALFDAFGSRADLYITRDQDGRCVAGGIGLRDATSSVVPWASALREVRPQCPNHSLYWTVLESCVERKLSRFDFGRSWLDSGTFRFKKQWGAEPVPLQWLELAPSGRLLPSQSLKPQEHEVLTSAWSRMPLFFATSVGGRMRRYFEN